MSIASALVRILSPREAKSLTLPENIGSYLSGGGKARTGVEVSPLTAMGLTAVYSAVNLISQSISSLPVKFLLSSDENKKAQRPQQWRALWDRPNPYQSRSAFWETMIASLLLWGNAYAGCVYNLRGDLIELWPIDPARVGVAVLPGGDVEYTIANHGREVVSAKNADGTPNNRPQIIAIRGLTLPGRIKGLSPIEQAMEQIGMGLAIERTASGFYGNGLSMSGYVSAPGDPTPEQAKQLASQLRAYTGVDNAGKYAVFGHGAEIKTLSIPPQQAQFLEQEKYSDTKVWALFRVPPHLVGDVSKSTSWGTGIEEQTIGFITYTLMPWIRKCEEAVSSAFFTGTDYEIEFAVQGLMRGSMEARYRAYAIGRAGGWLSSNDIRRKESEPPIGAEGDVYLTALNMSNLETLTAASAQADAEARAAATAAAADPVPVA